MCRPLRIDDHGAGAKGRHRGRLLARPPCGGEDLVDHLRRERAAAAGQEMVASAPAASQEKPFPFFALVISSGSARRPSSSVSAAVTSPGGTFVRVAAKIALDQIQAAPEAVTPPGVVLSVPGLVTCRHRAAPGRRCSSHGKSREGNGVAMIMMLIAQMARATQARALRHMFQPCGNCTGCHALTVGVPAKSPVRLSIREFKVVHRIPEFVARKTIRTKRRVLESHRQWRVIDTRCPAFVARLCSIS